MFFYLTVYNEPYPQPANAGAAGLREGVLRGSICWRRRPRPGPRAQTLASGISVRLAREAQDLLAQDWGVAADAWSGAVTSWNDLTRTAWQPSNARYSIPFARTYITTCLAGAGGPDARRQRWMRAVPDQISRWIPGWGSILETDGFGRSDTRAALRRHSVSTPNTSPRNSAASHAGHRPRAGRRGAGRRALRLHRLRSGFRWQERAAGRSPGTAETRNLAPDRTERRFR